MLLAHPTNAENCTQDCTSISLTAGNVGTGCSDFGGSSSGNTCSIPDGIDIPYGLTLNIGSGVTVNVGSNNGIGISVEVDCGGAINNAGTLTASGAGSQAIGIYNNGGTINNAGTMSGTASGTAAIGIQAAGGCSNGFTNIPGGPFNNAGTLTATATGSQSYGLFDSGNLNDYCGVTPSYNSLFPGQPSPTTYSCYAVTFGQSGIPTSGVTWGITTSWGPFPAFDNTGTGTSIPVEATGALTYSYDTPVGSADYNYNCNSGCSGTPTISGAASYAASYLAVAKTSSTTTVSCAPSSVGTGSPTTCTATVSGSSPTGTVSFISSSGTGVFSPSNGQCALSSGSCSVGYSDNIAGSPIITGSYGGDSNNTQSFDTFSLPVTINPLPTFSISSNSVGPYLGATTALTGFSFAPGSYFACLSTSSATTSSCVTTPIGGYAVNSGGAYSGSITVPPATAPGSYYVIVYTGTTVYVSAGFTITSLPASTFSISPTSVGPNLGVTITATGTNFVPGLYDACLSTTYPSVNCVTTPVGGYQISAGPGFTGSYSSSINVPASQAPGSYYVDVYIDGSTTAYTSASFTINAPLDTTFSVAPTSVGPYQGTTVALTGASFEPGNYVACLSNSYPSVSCVTTPTAGYVVGSAGSYSESLVVPPTTASGSYYVDVYLATSTTAYESASFTIAAPLAPTFSLSSSSIGPYLGTTINLTGANFVPGNYVACLSNSLVSTSGCVTSPTGGYIITAGSSYTGAYTESLTVPPTMSSGNYYVIVYVSGASTPYLSAAFAITSPPPPTFLLSASSVGPYLGTTISLTGANFAPGNYQACLSDSLVSPSGCVTTPTGNYLITASSSYTGVYSASVVVPPTTSSGNYYVIAYSSTTVYRSAAFAITTPPAVGLSLSPTFVGPYKGTNITLTGTNFAPGNYVACLSNSLVSTSGCVTTPTGGYIISAGPSYTGAYSSTVVLPPTTLPGNYYVIAYIQGFSSPYISAAFTITSPPSPTLSLSSSSVGPYLGTTVSLTGANLAPGNYETCLSNSLVSTSGCVTSPTGGYLITAGSSYTGIYSQSLVVPPTTSSGNYYVIVYVYGDSAPYLSTSFTINQPPHVTFLLSSSSVGPYLGTTIALTGSNFAPGDYEACLSNSLVSSSGCVTSPAGGFIITAGSSYTGAYSESVVVPPTTSSGSYYVIAYVYGTSTPYASAAFTITSPPTPTLTGSPSSVGPYLGTTMVLTGTNFAPGNYMACLSNSLVSTSGCVTSPTGGYIITASSSYTGAYTESLTVPPTTASGSYYVIVFVYGNFAPYLSAPFTINQPGHVTFSVSPSSVAPSTGTTISLTGANFAPGNYQACLSDTYVSTSGCVTSPTGGYVITAGSTYTGAYSATVTVGSSQAAGNYYVIVYSGTTVYTSAAFTVDSSSYVISDETSCLNLPASAEATETQINTCSVAGTLTIFSGVSLTVNSPWRLQIVGTLDNAGTITLNTDGGLQNLDTGTISNRGLINNVGTPNDVFDNDGGTITNDANGGTIYNGPGDTISNTGMINNHGTLNNDGLISNSALGPSAGAITNEIGATINNDYSNPEASPPLIQNTGGAVIDNFGTINNYADTNFPAANVEILDNGPSGITNYNSGAIYNFDGITITTGGDLSNDAGTVIDYCGGVVTGTVDGTPVVNECVPSLTLTPQTGGPGTVIALSGGNLLPSSTYLYCYEPNYGSSPTPCPTSAAEFTTDAFGDIPTSPAPTVTASGTSNGAVIVNLPEQTITIGVQFDLIPLTPTSLSVSCSPSPVAIESQSTCTGTVSGTSAATITGETLNFSQVGSAASLSETSCALVGDSCSVNAVGVSAGSLTISATYVGDTTYASSTGSTSLTVTQETLTLSPQSGPSGTIIMLSGGSYSPSSTYLYCYEPNYNSAPTACAAGSAEFTTDASGNIPTSPAPKVTASGTSNGAVIITDSITGRFPVGVQFDLQTTTTTTITCATASFYAGSPNGDQCTATVTGANPSGSVRWTSTGGSFSNQVCNLTLQALKMECVVDFLEGDPDQPIITATYSGDAVNLASSGIFELTVLQAPTSTSVSCSPSSVVVGTPTTCTAVVSDQVAVVVGPAGEVIFTDHLGRLPPTPCNLTPVAGTPGQASCSIQFTPSSGQEGADALIANYVGDVPHQGSTSQFTVTATQRADTVSVACAPSSVSVSSQSTCTALVTDTSGGTAVTPTGGISFSFSSAGTFPPNPCNLSPVAASATEASCSVQFTPSLGTVGTSQVGASYGGDVDHPSATATLFALAVTKAASSVTASCSPSTVTITSSTTCTAKVTGESPSGTVAFTSATSTGAFVPSSGVCTLTSGSCSVSYSDTTSGTITITATYSGDSNNLGSSSTTSITESYKTCSQVTNSGGQNLKGANLEYCNLAGLNMSGDNLQGANLNYSNLQNTNLKGANMQSATLANSNAAGANFQGANMQSAVLSNAILTGDNFQGANLQKADLAGDSASGADFRGANMQSSLLTGGDFDHVNFQGANMQKSDLSNGDFNYSDFTGANTQGANTTGATFVGATNAP